ncbi:putative G patch domain and ankyrin repeat-containing protein [Helianthus annuus]|nr:putative G patch domain and ankyrin repeat-containing protein [Helianthus annuus]KAJ0656634.1 putative G patch domain and ankyrin repeat-containing protein [Helianthus annuus]KAJ0660235.1 putative G patch domain and ankyrin repeat-containing protein [Helianthus annuus]KAJ0840741.1 putative G patch domain and ankyrin repeat-containing protein [Helianthus annuus]KAJ0854150.1 putative G patch domain and ankyrin repeat-containing protein [Helianthus annuus]
MNLEAEASSTSTPIASSNIGFQLLKKHGWKEGTGLGISQQGRLEPVQTYLKKNKRGLGAEIKKPHNTGDKKDMPSDKTSDTLSKKSKAKMSKKMRKAQEVEKKLQEKEFERAFFREFWPDNV